MQPRRVSRQPMAPQGFLYANPKFETTRGDLLLCLDAGKARPIVYERGVRAGNGREMKSSLHVHVSRGHPFLPWEELHATPKMTNLTVGSRRPFRRRCARRSRRSGLGPALPSMYCLQTVLGRPLWLCSGLPGWQAFRRSMRWSADRHR